ncbi:MAG: hypothetical protein LAT63_16625 [Marinobacter sp.]|nr:hypothetical protein [Marinobacter sp.]
MEDQVFGNNNSFTGFIVNTISPSAIYEHFFYIASVAAVVPWLFILFIMIRVVQESSDAITGKAALATALGDANKALLFYLGYTAAGFMIFGLILILSNLFQSFGGTQLIHNQMLELRQTLMADPEQQRAWYERLWRAAMDIGNIFSAGAVWGIYQFLSVFYIFLSQLIDVMFALGLALTYGWGFIAIATRVMRQEFNLLPGFTKTVLTFAIWAILEPLLLWFVWLMSLGAVQWLTAHHAGSDIGTTAITLWYMFSIVMMFLVLLIKIIAPFLALYLARNDSMVGALGAGPAALGAMVANQIVRMTAQSASNTVGGMLPSGEGTRTRDRLAQSVGDTMNTPLGQLFGGKGANDLSALDTPHTNPSSGSAGGSPASGMDAPSATGSAGSGDPTGQGEQTYGTASPGMDSSTAPQSPASPAGQTSTASDLTSGLSASTSEPQTGSDSQGQRPANDLGSLTPDSHNDRGPNDDRRN